MKRELSICQVLCVIFFWEVKLYIMYKSGTYKAKEIYEFIDGQG